MPLAKTQWPNKMWLILLMLALLWKPPVFSQHILNSKHLDQTVLQNVLKNNYFYHDMSHWQAYRAKKLHEPLSRLQINNQISKR